VPFYYYYFSVFDSTDYRIAKHLNIFIAYVPRNRIQFIVIITNTIHTPWLGRVEPNAAAPSLASIRRRYSPLCELSKLSRFDVIRPDDGSSKNDPQSSPQRGWNE